MASIAAVGEPTTTDGILFAQTTNSDDQNANLYFNYAENNSTTYSDHTRISLLSFFNETLACTGTLFMLDGQASQSQSPQYLSDAARIPLIDCMDQNQVNTVLGSGADPWPCAIVFNSETVGCEIVSNGSISSYANVFSLLDDLRIPNYLSTNPHGAINAERVTLVKYDAPKIFKTTLIAVTVSLVVILCVAIALSWWKFSRRPLRGSAAPRDGVPAHARRQRRKMAASDVEKFETFVYNVHDDTHSVHTRVGDVESAEMCSVCLEDYKQGDVLRRLGCQHIFHQECVDRWLTTRSTCCPLCRADFGSKDAEEEPQPTATGVTVARSSVSGGAASPQRQTRRNRWFFWGQTRGRGHRRESEREVERDGGERDARPEMVDVERG